MPQDVRIWEILEEDKLKELSKAKLNRAERIEIWLERDISIISDDLLVIGRQVNTDFGGPIDLLCLDHNGDTVIIELKRDKTPREITAQVLDYASWVNNLSNEKITEIANEYLGGNGPLEQAFGNKFRAELPEILNEHHKMLVVASEIDSSSERIIKYLSGSYGVGINAATFQYFHDEEGKEFLARVFLIEPSEVIIRTGKRPLSYEELERIAESNGVGTLYKKLVEGLSNNFDQKTTTRSSIAFIGIMGESKSRNTIFSLLPGESDSANGVKFQVYLDRFAKYFNIEKAKLLETLPNHGKSSSWAGDFGIGYFKEDEQVEEFLANLGNWLDQNKGGSQR